MQKITTFFFRFSLWLTAVFGGILVIMSVLTMGKYRKLFEGKWGFIGEYFAVVLLAVFIGIVLAVLYRRLEHSGTKMAMLVFAAIVLCQIAFLVLVSHPMLTSDPARVQNEALEMVKRQNGQLDLSNEYFQRYSNNHFLVVMLYYFYKLLFKCGITNVWVPTIVLNTFFVDAGIYITYRIARRLRGDAFANLLMILFLLCPTTYVWLTTTYTNTLSFPFVMAILYLCLWLRGGEPNLKNITKCILLGIAMAVGYWLRPTTILPIIAMILFAAVQFFKEPVFVGQGRDKVLNPKWDVVKGESGKRNTMIKGVLVLAVFALCFAGCRAVVNRHVNQDKLTGEFPITHWVMMGLNEESYGGFSRPDEGFTKSFPTKEEKAEANIEEIKNRLSQMGVAGVLRQSVVKLFRVWAMSDDDSMPKSLYAHDFPVLYQYFMGESNGWYLIFMQAFRVCIFVFLCVSVFCQLGRKRCDEQFLFALTFLGAVVFFLIWEANRKYNICFMGVYLLLMADGIHIFSGTVGQLADRRLIGRISVRWGLLTLAVVCLIGTAVLQYPMLKIDLHRKQTNYYNSRTFPDAIPLSEAIEETPLLIEQTIQKGQYARKGQWNHLTIYFKLQNASTAPNEKEYLVEIISLEDNKRLYREEIGQAQLNNDNALDIFVSKQKETTERGYLLRLTSISEKSHLMPLISKFPSLDPYPYGELTVNGRGTEYDLSMTMKYTE